MLRPKGLQLEKDYLKYDTVKCYSHTLNSQFRQEKRILVPELKVFNNNCQLIEKDVLTTIRDVNLLKTGLT